MPNFKSTADRKDHIFVEFPLIHLLNNRSTQHEGPQRVFSGIVVGLEPAVFQIDHQLVPVGKRIGDRLTQKPLGRGKRLFGLQPRPEAIQNRPGLLLVKLIDLLGAKPLFAGLVLDLIVPSGTSTDFACGKSAWKSSASPGRSRPRR